MYDRNHLNGVRTPLMRIAERARVQVVVPPFEPEEEIPLSAEETVPVAPEVQRKIGETVADEEVSLDIQVPDDASSIMKETESVGA
jgi:hypothetical protein